MTKVVNGILESVDPEDLVNGVFIIPDQVTHVNAYAFGNVRGQLKKVSFPSSVQSIGSNAFEKCTLLEDVILSEGIISIGEKAFMYCSALKNIATPSSVQRIEKCAFYGAGLKSITIKDGVIYIGENAFGYCVDLESITIPGTVEQIEFGAFLWCSSLKTVTILHGVASIGRPAFNLCENLIYVNLPGSIKNMDIEAFKWWRSKIQVTITTLDKKEYDQVTKQIPNKKVIAPYSPTQLPNYSLMNTLLEGLDELTNPLKPDIREIISEFHSSNTPPSLLAALRTSFIDMPIPVSPDLPSIKTRPLMKDNDHALYDQELEQYNADVSRYNAQMKPYFEKVAHYKATKYQICTAHISAYRAKLIFLNSLIDYLRILEKAIPSQYLFGTKTASESNNVNTLQLRKVIKKIIELLQDEQPITLSDKEKELIIQRKTFLQLIPESLQRQWELHRLPVASNTITLS